MRNVLRTFQRRRLQPVLLGFAAAIATVLFLAATAYGVIAIFSRTADAGTSPFEYFPDVLNPVTAAAAILGVVISIYNIHTSVELARKTQQAMRFQKASELISDRLQTAEVAGVSLLEELVRENPAEFSGPTLLILKAFIAESIPEGLEGRLTPSHMEHPFHRTRMAIVQAVRLINFINKKAQGKKSRVDRQDSKPVIVYSLYLARWNREALSVRNLEFRSVIASFWSMNGGNITGCSVEGHIGRKVRLSGTRLNGTRFKLKRIDAEPLTPWDKDFLHFDDCAFDKETTINGYSMEDWVALADSPPPPAGSDVRVPFASYAHEPAGTDEHEYG